MSKQSKGEPPIHGLNFTQFQSGKDCISPTELLEHVIGKNVQTQEYPALHSPNLRRLIAKNLNEKGTRLGQDNIVVSNGTVDIIKSLGLAFVDKTRAVHFSRPSFFYYFMSTEFAGGQSRDAALKPDGNHNLNQLCRDIDGKSALIFLPNPNYPTGKLLSKEDIEAFMKQIPPSVLVIVDEAFMPYANKNESSVELVHRLPNLGILVGPSKTGMAGYRIGYLVAHKNVCEAVSAVTSPYPASLLSEIALELALKKETHIAKISEKRREIRDAFCQKLGTQNIKYMSSEASYVCINVNETARTFVDRALKPHGIVVNTLAPPFDHWIQLAPKGDENDNVLLEVLANSIKRS